jgi:recombination protein RecT
MAEIVKKNVQFSVAIRSDAYQNLINSTLGDAQTAKKFVADISSVVSQNNALKRCDAGSIVSAGLTAQSLGLPLSPTLGFCYVVPYGNLAQFQVGWKGLVQLAIRTNLYKKIGVRPVHKGEALGLDEFGDEVVKFDHAFDQEEVVGYFAYFELTSGFKKTLYWTVDQCKAHAKRYSKSYGNGSATDNWSNMFDTMAQKTVLKQLISKFGILSVEIIKAIESDQAVVNSDGTMSYVDNVEVADDGVVSRKTTVINSIPTEEETDGE